MRFRKGLSFSGQPEGSTRLSSRGCPVNVMPKSSATSFSMSYAAGTMPVMLSISLFSLATSLRIMMTSLLALKK
jgi:hypothetical protein